MIVELLLAAAALTAEAKEAGLESDRFTCEMPKELRVMVHEALAAAPSHTYTVSKKTGERASAGFAREIRRETEPQLFDQIESKLTPVMAERAGPSCVPENAEPQSIVIVNEKSMEPQDTGFYLRKVIVSGDVTHRYNVYCSGRVTYYSHLTSGKHSHSDFKELCAPPPVKTRLKTKVLSPAALEQPPRFDGK